MKRINIVLDGEELFYDNEVITYEKLCKVISDKKKIKVVYLKEYIFLECIEFIKDKKIEEYIEKNILLKEENRNYLLDYRVDKQREKTYIYGIRVDEVVLKLFDRFKDVELIPIQMLLWSREEFNYEIIYGKKKFYSVGKGKIFESFNKVEKGLEKRKVRVYPKKIEVIK